MKTILQPQQNQLLRALPGDVQAELYPHLELTALPRDYLIHQPSAKLKYTYFPATCIISKIGALAAGNTVEIASIGNEGMVSICVFMGGDSMPYETIVRSPGAAYRIRSEILLPIFQRSLAVQGIFLRYAQALITQMTQTAVCNRHHNIEQRLCNFLLMTHDKLTSNEIEITQEKLSYLLGVRRESITEAAKRLQEMDIIQYSRGHITIIDRLELESTSCECYDIVSAELHRLLPNPQPVIPQRSLAKSPSYWHRSGL